ncbi:MAG: hypothetical protein ABL883_00740 [Terricaulis sp.]
MLGPKLTRRVMVCLLAGACVSAPRQETVNVLFVCLHGTVKSPIAREHMRRMVAERGLQANIQSRGIAPEDAVTPQLAAALAADGIDVGSEPLQQLTTADLAAADIIVLFNPLPASLGLWPARDWSDTPSMNADYPAARAALLERLADLVDELASASTRR